MSIHTILSQEIEKMFKNTDFQVAITYEDEDGLKQFITDFATRIVEETQKEIVVCAAIKSVEGKIFRGQRHGDCMYAADRAYWTKKDIQNAEQGFITSTGRFVGREEGRKLQDAAGIKSASEDGYQGDTLFSEDLY